MSETRLTRSNNDKIIAGVAGGVASYLAIDPTLVRIGFLILLFASGIGFPIYFILWVVMPQDDGSEDDFVQKKLGDLSDTVSSNVNKLGRPGTIGVILILLGAYFLLNQLGVLSWVGGAVFWPLVIIGFGVYLLLRNNK